MLESSKWTKGNSMNAIPPAAPRLGPVLKTRTPKPFPERCRVFFVLTAVALAGCSSSTYKVATAQNVYDFRLARYDEACHVQDFPAWCSDYQKKLNAFEKHLHEAAVALKWGGGMPLQLDQLKQDEKAVKP